VAQIPAEIRMAQVDKQLLDAAAQAGVCYAWGCIVGGNIFSITGIASHEIAVDMRYAKLHFDLKTRTWCLRGNPI
jgi:hypothetical protein